MNISSTPGEDSGLIENHIDMLRRKKNEFVTRVSNVCLVVCVFDSLVLVQSFARST